MGYIIEFWQLPTNQTKPASFDEAEQLLDTLKKQKPENLLPKFRQLAQNLMAACPDPEDAEPEDAPWPEAPLYGEEDCAVWSITPNLSMIDELMPIMVQQAHALGLSMTDPQSGISYCPGDLIDFGTSDNNSGEDEAEGSPKNKEAQALVFEGLRPLMEKYGYKAYKGKRVFRREFPEGVCRIKVLSYNNSWPLYAEFNIVITLSCHSIWDFVDPDYPPEDREYFGTISVNKNWLKQTELCRDCGTYEIKRLAQIDQALDELIEQLEYALPILAEIKTVEDFDSVLNTGFENIADGEPPGAEVPKLYDKRLFAMNRTENILERTVAAYLSGNPILPNLCEFYAGLDNNKRERILELIEYFKENPRSKR